MLYAPRACTAPPVHSVTQSICYIYIIITTPCRYCRQCYTRMLYATLRASRFACCCIIQYTIHMHPYHIVSYNILSSAHTTLLRYRIVSQQQQVYIPGNTSTMHTYHDRKGKSFFYDHKSSWGLSHFKVVSVGGLRF
jgi:hypothetical protein